MALLILLIEGRRYHAISCDIICVLRPWFDRHSVRRSNPTEASACGGRERTCRTSSNPNFQQSLLAIIYASFSFLFQGEGSGSFLLLTVSSWQHTHSKPEYHFSKENMFCSVGWMGWIHWERENFVYYSFELCDMHKSQKLQKCQLRECKPQARPEVIFHRVCVHDHHPPPLLEFSLSLAACFLFFFHSRTEPVALNLLTTYLLRSEWNRQWNSPWC